MFNATNNNLIRILLYLYKEKKKIKKKGRTVKINKLTTADIQEILLQKKPL